MGQVREFLPLTCASEKVMDQSDPLIYNLTYFPDLTEERWHI